MSSAEIFSIICKPWANINDIKVLASCGRDTASKIRNTIIINMKKTGQYLPTSKKKIVPMIEVIDYLNLDINHICSMAKKEKALQITS